LSPRPPDYESSTISLTQFQMNVCLALNQAKPHRRNQASGGNFRGK